jgi:hypothetical protein
MMKKFNEAEARSIEKIMVKTRLEQHEMTSVVKAYIYIRKGVKVRDIHLRSMSKQILDPLFLSDFQKLNHAYDVAVNWLTKPENQKLWKYSK